MNGTEIFSKYVLGGKLSGAFLLIGSDEESLKESALEFASLVNCSAQQPLPCGECYWCVAVDRGYHPDFSLLEPSGASMTIKISEVRGLIEKVMMSPYQAARKTSIVLSADAMTEEAANSFLKILEEPPADTVFIFTTVFPDKLLSTIRSRCKELIIDRSGGFDALLPCDMETVDILRGSEDIDQNISRDEFYSLLCRSLGYYRDMMVYKSTGITDAGTEIFLNGEIFDYIREDADASDISDIMRRTESLERLVNMIRNTYLNIKLVIQNLFIENIIPLPHRGIMTNVK